MNEELTPVRRITDKTNDWKAKVTIAEKWYERSCKTSPSKYQKLVLIDAEVNFRYILIECQNTNMFNGANSILFI